MRNQSTEQQIENLAANLSFLELFFFFFYECIPVPCIITDYFLYIICYILLVLLSGSLNQAENSCLKGAKIYWGFVWGHLPLQFCNETNPTSRGLNAKQPRVKGQEITNIGNIWSQ